MTTPSTDRSAIAQIIKAVKAAGWVLDHVDDGEDGIPAYDTAQIALNAITAVDTAYLYVHEKAGGPGGTKGWIYFVLGNEPFEVAADYTLNLESAIGPLMEGWDE
jgi:hypothetical protein